MNIGDKFIWEAIFPKTFICEIIGFQWKTNSEDYNRIFGFKDFLVLKLYDLYTKEFSHTLKMDRNTYDNYKELGRIIPHRNDIQPFRYIPIHKLI